MSHELVTPAWKTKVGHAAAKSLLVLLADSSNAEGWGFPLLKKLREETELSPRQIQRILQIFQAIGLLAIEQRRVVPPKPGEKEDRRKRFYVFTLNRALLGTDISSQFKACFHRLHGEDMRPTDAHLAKEHVPRTRISQKNTSHGRASGQTMRPTDGFSHSPIRKEPFVKSEPFGENRTALKPYPSVPEGMRVETQQVMRECHFTDKRLARVITEALEQYAQFASVEVAEAARIMIQNHADFIKLGPYLRYRWGERNWIKQGHWVNVNGWPIDQTKFDQDKHMRVGLQ